ncbi:hypothetical protein BJX61DRAFT_546122 [Aspergillus egyptiacus]|nr:hypothetical protein BJX61DRAFT_546122 [Aspergillus egyptiacus]
MVVPSSSPPTVSLPMNIATKLKPPAAKEPALQPTPYPQPIQPGYPTPHDHVTVEPVSTAHLPSLSRISGLLLPIRYPNSFFTATVTDPVIASLSRVAVYHDHPVAAAPSSAPVPASTTGTDKVVGGIRCRLERLPESEAPQLQPGQHEPTNLYISTLQLLSPYRGYGIAASLLNSLLFSSPPAHNTAPTRRPDYKVSDLVKHYNIRTVTAHVHEANDEGLKWYISRGFQVQGGTIENYYRRLKPSGAKLVKLVVRWDREDRRPTQDGEQPSRALGEAHTEGSTSAGYDDDWEKVEGEDELDADHLGVWSFTTESKLSDSDSTASRKRKADEEPQRS